MAFLERLKAGVKNTRIITFFGEPVTLRVLSELELQECRTLADGSRERLGLDDDTIMVETVLRQLYRAAADRDGKPLADSFDAFKGFISRSEREFLTGEYLELEQDCSPRPETLTDAEYEALKEEVKKSPDFLLNPQNTALLKKLFTYLVNRPRS